MKITALALLLGTTAFTGAALAQTSPQAPARNANAPTCQNLVQILEQRGNSGAPSGVTLEQARTYQRDNNAEACRAAFARLRPTEGRAAGEARVVVQEGAAQVRVQQAQPQVTVRQGQPEIIVRQGAPTITVDIPQPEIIVRMPDPQVNVAQAQPQVSVNQPEPQVRVVQPAQPRVQVQSADAQVQVSRTADEQPNVRIEQASEQPNVRFEMADPNVVVNRGEGQPNVRMERADGTAMNREAGANRQADAAAGSGQGAAPSRAGRETPPARPDVAGDSGRTPAAVAVIAAIPAGQTVTAATLNDMSVYNERGDTLGDVERVVRASDGKVHLVIGAGGFLGLGETHVLIPLERVRLRNEQLIMHGMTDEQVKQMPRWNGEGTAGRELTGDQPVQMSAAQ